MTFWQKILGLFRSPAPPPVQTPVKPQLIPVSSFPSPSAPLPPVPGLLTKEQLRGLYPALSDRWIISLFAAMSRWGILSRKQAAAFLAQVMAESGGIALNREGLNYRVDALLSTFGRGRISATDALRLGRKPGEGPLSTDRQREIANLVYGGEYGVRNLGNTQPGDGWFFRGAPLIQLTGRANWEAYGKTVGMDNAELATYLMTPEGAADSAAWFWANRGCIPLANALPDVNGEEGKPFEALTRKINGGLNGLDHRKAKYRETVKLFARA